MFFLFSFIGTILATILGSILAIYSFKLSKRVLNLIQNFAIGIIIGLIFFEFFDHSIEGFNGLYDPNILSYLIPIAIILGTGIIFTIFHEIVHKLSKHHDKSPDDNEECLDHGHTSDIFHKDHSMILSSIIFLLAIMVHNIPEGFSFGIIFNETNEYGLPISGLIMSLVMLIHNIIIGYTMTTSFKSSNKSNTFSIGLTSLSSVLTYILAIVGFYSNYYLSDLSSSIIISIATGSLLYVLFIELLPETFYKYKDKYTFIYILLGILITFILLFL